MSVVEYLSKDAVATIRLNRPETRNALDNATKDALVAAVSEAAGDPAVRCVVLTGTGPAFCAGQDLREHAAKLGVAPEELFESVPRHYIPIARGLATMPKPVIAAVNGIAAGAGAALAFACDFRLVADSAGFNLAFAGIGLSCDTGTSWTLPRLIGHARAIDLLLRPRTISATEALELGLATSVVAADELPDAAASLAAELAAGPTQAFAAIRDALNYSATHGLDESLVHEGELMRSTGATEDHSNAVNAFLAKQRPTFEGR
ncbi:enoyl-CoA hydratase/isomerase family protein [Flindersiella endophytica]